MYPKTYDPRGYQRQIRARRTSVVDAFSCQFCRADVSTLPLISGVLNRNHCPYCLRSRHVDLRKPGDRMSACKAIMQPIGLTMKPAHDKFGRLRTGELMLIHLCSGCGKLSINRIAADDMDERLLDIYHDSLKLAGQLRQRLEESGIFILQADDRFQVTRQLRGALQM